MFSELISMALSNLLYLALHVEGNGSFPKPLTLKMEQEYFALKEKGDNNAKNKLIEHNLRLVAHIVKKYYSVTNDQDDLISIGTIGLIKAVNTFSYEKGTKFATYASRCIENEILMHFRNIKKSANDVYISDPIDSDGEGNSVTLLDVVSDEESIIDNIDLKMKSEQLHKYIDAHLASREKKIIEMRYGLNGKQPLTQREIAQSLKISRSYVSRIEKKALLCLRHQFEKADKACKCKV
ncbi:MAG: RNA polymerase sporulation sigma factor SigK [Oscillospiraceae bacterium]